MMGIMNDKDGTMMKKDRNKNDFVMDRLAKITGQKPTLRVAKKAVASFKTRIGDKIGVAVTLRGDRMYGFIDKLFNATLPRTKDFRGISRTSVDAIGNITFGIKEHSIFPEIADEEIKDIFGMAVTIVTTAKTTINHGSERCFEKNECFFFDTRKYYERDPKMQ